VRTLEGQREFSERFGRLSGAAAGPGVAVLARERPLDVALFAVVKLLALTALRRKRRSGRCSWERDESSRAPAPAAR
jgi:hypothetical protein